MKTETSPSSTKLYFRLLIAIFVLSILAIGSITIVAGANHMDLITFIASLNAKPITVSELQQHKLQKPLILIDVRSPEEYDEDHIGNSKLVPLTDIQDGEGIKQVVAIAKSYQKLNQVQPTILLYCTAGSRSVKAYKQLEKTGLNLAYLKGGINAWRQTISPKKDAEILDILEPKSLKAPHQVPVVSR